jgi:hypothetical protein
VVEEEELRLTLRVRGLFRKRGDLRVEEEFEVEGIPVILNKGHEMYLVGMEIEFEGGLNSTLTSSTYGALVLIGV